MKPEDYSRRQQELAGWAISLGDFGRGLPGNVRFLVGDGTTQVAVFVDESVPFNVFSHCAGVIDRQRNEIRIYWNGEQRGVRSRFS